MGSLPQFSGNDWAALAQKESDCGSARDGGDLGFFGRYLTSQCTEIGSH